MMLKRFSLIVIYLFVAPATAFVLEKSPFQLSLIHLNDFHDRYEETSAFSGVCKNKNCIGGFSRVYTAINQLRKERPNPIVLNAGDNFQGTLWYTFYKWNVTQHFFNLIPTDVYTLGNHEFDDGVKELASYLKGLNAPTVVANIDDTEEPDIQGLYNKSVIIERDGRRIGIIGVISQRTHELSSTGKLRFLNESMSVNNEAERLVAEEDVDTIIVLSHCGYEAEKIIAQNAAPKIGVIVGSHSHTFLYTGETLLGPEKPRGPYPTIINHEDGRTILVVQASADSKYLGNITVKYDDKGNVISWSGAPIYLNESIPQDLQINQELQIWKEEVEAQGKKIVGQTKVLLSYHNCRYEECNLGNFVTDAMVYSHLETNEGNAWTYAAIAVTNSGSLRTSIPIGSVTYNDIALTLPFQNTFDVVELQGKYLKQFLEYPAGHHNNTTSFKINLMPVAGLRIIYNTTKPIGSRIQSLKVRCRECSIPLYEELDQNKYYRVVVNSFIAAGGDGHTILANNKKILKTGGIGADVLVKYVQKQSPIIQELQGRIKVVR